MKVAHALTYREGRNALRFGVVSAMDARPVLRRLQPSLILDVGANRGQFVLDVLHECPKALVIAFEPLESERAILQRALASHLARVELLPYALGTLDVDRPFYVTEHRDSSSLLPPTRTQVSAFPGSAVRSQLSVPVRRLDTLLGDRDLPPDVLLKLDVQGSELDVIGGAAETIQKVRWIWAELSVSELYEGQPLVTDVVVALHSLGFRLVDLGRPTRLRGVAVQLDALFERHG